MSGILFDYFDGYLRVVFHPVEYGMVPFDLIMHGDVRTETPCDDHYNKGAPVIHAQDDVAVRVWISSALGGFGGLVRWLKGVTCGVQECAFTWDGEGPDGELRWHDAWDSGLLKVTWTEDDFVHKLRLNKAQMVRAFYESFRDYVESDAYSPLDYEELDAGETFALVLEERDLDALADHLTALCRDAAESLVDEMLDFAYDTAAGYPRRASLATFKQRAEGRVIEPPAEHRWIVQEWDQLDFAQRRRDIVEKIFKGGTGIAYGEKLRSMRSPLIEKWLSEHTQAQGTVSRA